MKKRIINDFLYSDGSEACFCYLLPKILFTGKAYTKLSDGGKLLYALFLDRLGSCQENGWFDEQDRAYIIFPVREIVEVLGWSKGKAVEVLKELEEYGLIDRKKRWLGQPDMIYPLWPGGMKNEKER